MTNNFSPLTQKVVSSYLLSTSQRKTLEDDLKSLAAAFEAAAEHIDNQADKLLYGPRQKALEQAVWVLMHVVNELKSSSDKQPRRLLWELMQEKAAPYSHPRFQTAAMIRAVRDHLFPVDEQGDLIGSFTLSQAEDRMQLRAFLTDAAVMAEAPTDLSRLTDKELEELEASIPQGYHAV